jgi:hypothetical protein
MLFFLLRSPVLVVSDPAFDFFYRSRRLAVGQIRAALELFRPVKNVRISGEAGEEVAVFVVESAAAKPYCVLFPFRYRAEGRRYAREHPGIPTGLLVGRGRAPDYADGLVPVATDTAADLYRAGRLAAILAEEGSGGGEVLFIYDDYPEERERDSFQAGLAAGGYAGTVNYAAPDFPSAGSVFRAAVIRGPGRFDAADRPALLFSWMDPARVPANIKVVFDDSPWVQAAEAARIVAGRREVKKIPSVVHILGRRLVLKGQKSRLKSALASPAPGGIEG